MRLACFRPAGNGNSMLVSKKSEDPAGSAKCHGTKLDKN